jgi:hypothetical protein
MARFYRRGVSKVYFLPAVVSVIGSPTAPEITAGTQLTNDVAEISGFQLTNSPIPTPDLQSTFTKSIVGEDTTDTSIITFYDTDVTSPTPIRTALIKGAAGFIVLMPYGNTTGKRCESWPVRSTGVADEWTVGNDPARFQVSFAITDVPMLSGVLV